MPSAFHGWTYRSKSNTDSAAYFAAIAAIGAADSLEQLDRVEAKLRAVWAETPDSDSLREELTERHGELTGGTDEPFNAVWVGRG